MHILSADNLIMINKVVCRLSGQESHVLDIGKIEGALVPFEVSYGDNEHVIASKVFRNLIIAHGFVDGNKRTACIALGCIEMPACSEMELANIALEIAKGKYRNDIGDLPYRLYNAEMEALSEKVAPPDYAPTKTGKAYKVFKVKNGKLYPPKVANPGGEDTPIGVWLDAEEGEFAGLSKTGRPQVKSIDIGNLSYRPGWHLGDVPRAPQFDRRNKKTGEMEFPKDFVWAECDYAMDIDYQPESDAQGYMRTKVDDQGNVSWYKSDKYQHSLAGLPKLPKDGYYKYRTNPRPDTVPWVITGQMKVNRLLSDDEVNEILKSKGIEPIHRQGGDKTLAELGLE